MIINLHVSVHPNHVVFHRVFSFRSRNFDILFRTLESGCFATASPSVDPVVKLHQQIYQNVCEIHHANYHKKLIKQNHDGSPHIYLLVKEK